MRELDEGEGEESLPQGICDALMADKSDILQLLREKQAWMPNYPLYTPSNPSKCPWALGIHGPKTGGGGGGGELN